LKKKKTRKAKPKILEYVIGILLIAFLLFVISNIFFPPSPEPMTSGDAVIIDQLSIISQNQTFLDSTTQSLESAGIGVDIYSGDEVSIELYKRLPSLGYKIIIFRAHSAYPLENPELIQIQNPEWPVYLFTSEPYDENKYLIEQLTDQVAPASVTEDSPTLFSIGPEFIRNSMNGEFPNSLIIISSCGGLYSTDLADAFIEKGVRGVISWSDLVDLDHTDNAIDILIKSLCVDGSTIGDAISLTMNKVGPDPSYESILLYYPNDLKEENINKIISIANIIKFNLNKISKEQILN